MSGVGVISAPHHGVPKPYMAPELIPQDALMPAPDGAGTGTEAIARRATDGRESTSPPRTNPHGWTAQDCQPTISFVLDWRKGKAASCDKRDEVVRTHSA
jgi:hypothetical protein